MLVERANLLNLTVPEMTVLVGGMRALNANVEGNSHGVLTKQPGTLSNDFIAEFISKGKPGLSNKRFRLWLASRSQSNLIR
jgi:catalase (peroxidase I)